MEEKIATTLIVIPPKTLLLISFITGVALASSYYMGKRVQKYVSEADKEK